MGVEVVFMDANECERVPLDSPLELQPLQQTTLRHEEPHTDGVFVVPIAAAEGVVAAVLVANAFHGRVALNGSPLHAGVSVLRHTDCLVYAGHRWWICAESSAEQVPYDPKVHGDDVFCMFTKARIAAGEMVVCCPGKPGVECNAIYKAGAWNLAMQAEKPVNCLSCGYKPPTSRWEPIPAKERRSQVDAILQSIKKG